MPTAPASQRIAENVVLINARHHAEWLQRASATPGLPAIDRRILSCIAEHNARRQRGGAGRLSIEGLAFDLRALRGTVRTAVTHLVEAGLIAVQRGSGQRGSSYHICLPRHTVVTAALEAAHKPAAAL